MMFPSENAESQNYSARVEKGAEYQVHVFRKIRLCIFERWILLRGHESLHARRPYECHFLLSIYRSESHEPAKVAERNLLGVQSRSEFASTFSLSLSFLSLFLVCTHAVSFRFITHGHVPRIFFFMHQQASIKRIISLVLTGQGQLYAYSGYCKKLRL